MHILIVDDEYYIVQGIIEGIEWDALGIDKISSAFSMSVPNGGSAAHGY